MKRQQKDDRLDIRARIPANSELAAKLAAYEAQLPISTSQSRLICHLIELGLKAASAGKAHGEAA
jgi:hypothetical protein